jgi:hypothetical protein
MGVHHQKYKDRPTCYVSAAHLLNFLFSSLLLLFFRFYFSFRSFPYLVTLRHGCIINHAPTLGACHLSRVVDHNRGQGAALSSDAVLYIGTLAATKRPCCSNTAGSDESWKVFIHLIRLGIQYSFHILRTATWFCAACRVTSKYSS